jgi:hypothetical protein
VLKKRPYQYNINNSMDEPFEKFKSSKAMYQIPDIELEEQENGEYCFI